jgi:hypothetical protein
MVTVETASSLRFAAAARAVSAQARALGLTAPGFLSPPRVPGADRTLRRRPDGSALVAVRVRGRPVEAIVADLVEGVLAANGLAGADASRARRALWAGVQAAGTLAA